MFNDLHRAMQRSQSALSQQIMVLSATLLCLVFTTSCGVQHLQRAGKHHLSLFEGFYFVVVTFTTVGYGDIYPDIFPSQLFMILMICIAFIVLPSQLEQLAFTWMERVKQGGTYSRHRAKNERHVVVCATTLQTDTIMDFLNEFYAHPMLQDYYVVLLSPCELDATMRMILQVPIWAQRVIYIRGSALKDADLTRARMNAAEACFIIAARNYSDRAAADQHTILRSWAVKDFAPECPQYVQIFRPENKVHVKFAEHMVCEDEFKYALTANNCLCPGISTMVTLLLHTSRGQEGQSQAEDWQRIYGKHSGNEIYHIRLEESKFFGEYEGKSYPYATFHAHRKFGISLIGVQKDTADEPILLNPGPCHIMCKSDICYYMSITKEENSAFILAHPNLDRKESMKDSMSGSLKEKTKKGNHSNLVSNIANIESATTTASTVQEEFKALQKGTVALELQPTRTAEECDSSTALTSAMDPPPIDGPAVTLAPARSSGNCLELPLHNAMQAQPQPPKPQPAPSRQRRPSILPVPCIVESSQDIRIHLGNEGEEDDEDEDAGRTNEDDPGWIADPYSHNYVRGFPPVSPYIGTSPTLCHVLKEKRPPCCLQLAQACEHCPFKTAFEYQWPNRAIILAADFASNGIYNFIVPLRAHYVHKNKLNPIVLLLEVRPDPAFLDSISFFPMIYWMLGSIDCIDDLLRAGINLADNVVVINKESSNSVEEDYLADCNTIVSVQTMFKLFPRTRTITELSQSSNMRFMQFRAKDSYSANLSQLEKREKERGSHLSYMFRLPFSSGMVFSASMLDTLLYQAFVKDYVIMFVRLLLGIDQEPGSGYLSKLVIKKSDLWIRTYGRLYQKLCSTCCDVPIGIYRTSHIMPNDTSTCSLHVDNVDNFVNCAAMERQEISMMVRCRMQDLGLPRISYEEPTERKPSLSYVIMNPSYDFPLELGDIIYVIKPSSLKPHEVSPLIERRRSFKVDRGAYRSAREARHAHHDKSSNSLKPKD